MKKTGIAVAIISTMATLSFANEFVSIIQIEKTTAQKTGNRVKNVSQWVNIYNKYNCSSWSPEESSINLGLTYTQTRSCLQDQSRTKDIYTVYNTGEEFFIETITDNQTITETESQSAIGMKNFISTERSEAWSNWSDSGAHYDCDTWSPNVDTVDYGDSFTQTRDCSQDQTRSRNVFNVWADGTETLNTVETGNQTITETETQSAIGTKNFKDTTRAGNWSSWTDSGSHYDCETWTPNVNTIDYGDSFTQTRDCSQDQTRSRDVFDVWADGTETLNRVETDNQTISKEESKGAVGTKNFKDTTRAGNWSSWTDSGIHYACNTWSPNVNTIDYGDSFTQTRDCSQDQIRSRNIFDVWADGSETLNRVEAGNQTISEEESQSAIGTKNFKDTTRIGDWSSWTDSGSHYDCETWTPNVDTVAYGDSFTQTRDCSQDQTRSRNIFDVWADGSETLNRVEAGNQTITETESQGAVGTNNFISSERNGNWSNWTDSGSHYDCDTWSPNVDTVPYGDSFTQTRDCSQNQIRSRDVFDVWADGTETLNRVETGNQTISEEESQAAVGTKNFISSERSNSWSSWSDSGVHYDCDTWSPNVNTINYGNLFTQTRDCSQDQTRSRDVFDVWADGTETLNRVETDNQTINEEELQAAAGAKNFIFKERANSWSIWLDSGAHYNCGTWNPTVDMINNGESFTQIRDCSQNQIRSRDVFDVWADGSETLNRVETGNQTISEEESQAAVGTKNFISSERANSWSNWSNSGSHYNCETWNPTVDMINNGESFTQIRDCSQDQTRSRDVFDVWADGTETLNRVETGNQTINEEESQSAIGIKEDFSYQVKIQASDKGVDDRFSQSISISGDTAIVGSHYEDSLNFGAAYIYQKNGYNWLEKTKLQASDKQSSDSFGYSVSISGNTAIIGAPFKDSSENGFDAGGAYIYEHNGSTWIEKEILEANDKEAGDYFGFSTSISGDTAIIGAFRAGIGGAAYIYKYNGSTWIEQAKLEPSDKETDDYFGQSVSISGNIAIVGARNEDTGGSNAGAAYIYQYDGSTWVEQAKLQASDKKANSWFGFSTSISGDTAVVGAMQVGTAYIYKYNGSNWVEQTKLQASDNSTSNRFGYSVSISDDTNTLVIGEPKRSNGETDTGAAYIFEYNGSSWVEKITLEANDKEARDQFGSSVSIFGDNVIVGAYFEDTGGTNTGSAYIFE